MSINEDHIIGIEINKNAIKDAKENATRNGLKDYKFIAKNAKFIDSNFIKENKIDAITVDPPRAGLDKKVVDMLKTSGVEKIVYISCNHASLARDVALMSGVYKVERVAAVDMFARSAHIENVVLMTRK